MTAALAVVRFTTAPELSGPDASVDPAPFSPADLKLYLARGSLTYQLVETGLRDGLRMRLVSLILQPRSDREDDADSHEAERAAELADRYEGYVDAEDRADDQRFRALLVAAALLAPLDSASRPVWLHIDRTMLDHGPDKLDCIPGLPANGLQPKGLRDLRIVTLAFSAYTCDTQFDLDVYRIR